VDCIASPIKGPDGSVEKYVIVVHYLSEIKSLEQQVADYTANLERIVGERTRELEASNALLAATAERVGRAARSGEMLAVLTDRGAVVEAFLKRAKDIVGADFLALVLKDMSATPPKVEQYSIGTEPEGGGTASEAIEAAISRMMLESAAPGRVWTPEAGIMLAEFVSGREAGLLICRRARGRFSPIDVDLAHLVCTQLSFALPAAGYVAEQRREREKAECLRRIAFRIAGVASVKEAVRVVAEEVSQVVPAERFLWLAAEAGGCVWVTEVMRRDGSPAERSVRIEVAGAACAGLSVADAAGDGACERLRGTGGAIDAGCRFLAGARGAWVACALRERLVREGLIGDDTGACAIVPMWLGGHSPSYFCAHAGPGATLADDDVCFMCLAASSVRRVWCEAAAASSIRRLEKTGEAMVELAHDLKYPTSKITGLLRRLASGDVDPTESRSAAAALLGDAEYLAALSREFVDLSKPTSDRPELIDLVRVLEDSIALAADDLERKSIVVERRFGRERPLRPVFASRTDVSRIFINLMANAHDAAGEGGWIRVDAFMDETRGDGPWVTVTFRNSGPPVSPSMRAFLFSPFRSSKDGGTGLGLFSARRRANANGGDVAFEADEDGVERFVVRFPAAFGP